MKKITLSLLAVVLAYSFTYAGGLVTNTNQSAAWARMFSRNATTNIDAAYFNPAGLTKLKDGFHISISNQTIGQTKTIVTYMPGEVMQLNNNEYQGDVFAPVFPSIYAVYKTGRFAFSFGFNPIGGGGSADFNNGLPSIDIPIASLVPVLHDYGARGYSANVSFSGSSVYWGLQLGVSYAINDHISVYLGGRYVMAKNTYTGFVKDVSIVKADGTSERADSFMKGLGDQAKAGGDATKGAGDSMQGLMDNNLGGLTFDQAEAVGAIDAAQKAQLEGGLLQIGLTQEQIDAMTLEQAQNTYYTASQQYYSSANSMYAGAALMGDQDADITQTGSGIAPIIGVNLSFLEDHLNIGLKYEFKTKMDLTNKTEPGKGFIIGLNPDGTPIEMFPDGAKTNADIPALFSAGVDYRIGEKLLLSGSYTLYFDKGAGWATSEKDGQTINYIDNNSWELGLGVEYWFTKGFFASVGFDMTKSGVNDNYQDAFSYSLNTSSVAFGGGYKFNDTFTLNAGFYYVMYQDQTVDKTYDMWGQQMVPYSENYEKTTWGMAIGLDISILSKKNK